VFLPPEAEADDAHPRAALSVAVDGLHALPPALVRVMVVCVVILLSANSRAQEIRLKTTHIQTQRRFTDNMLTTKIPRGNKNLKEQAF